jgi:peptidoglycan hydrolase-like protein with peptidoglycan-binding domain
MSSPRDARIAGAFVVVLAGGVVWNVAYLQDAPRDRRRASVPVGVHVPLPNAQPAQEARRPSGPVTLSLAALIEQSEGKTSEATPDSAQPPAPDAGGMARLLERSVRTETHVPAPSQPPTGTLVRDVQSALASRGYEPGVADGNAGPITRAAILAFEHDYGLAATAEPTEMLLAALRAPTRRATSGARWQRPTEAASGVVRTVQQHLIASGHLRGQATGVLDAATIAAIRTFETTQQLAPTGRISAPLMARLLQSRARIASGQ